MSLVVGPPLLAASCSNDGNSGAGGSAGAPMCPPPRYDALRCSGDDPTFVFFPPLSCDPSKLDDAGVDGSADAADAGPCANVTSLDVSFTSAACGAFLKAESQGMISYGSGQAPIILEPSNGAALTPEAWSIFSWAGGSKAQGPMRGVLDWIEPSARALPLNGDGFILEFSQGCNEVMRVMVAELYWVPDAASWSRLTALKGPVTVRVTSVQFANDAIAPGTTPFAGAPITITMTD